MRRVAAVFAALSTVVPALLASPTALAAARATATPGAPSPVIGGDRLASRGLVVDLPPGVPPPPAFTAASFVLADLDTGAVLVAKDAHGRFLPASTLKTLTVLTVLPHVDPRAVVQALPEDLVDGTKVGLAPGSHYTVEQLLQGTMLSSGNDTATALARAAGGLPQTVGRMQQEARRLGAYDTTVRNPSGLDAPDQLTSAYDLALIGRAAMALPDFRTLVATKRIRFPGKEVRGVRRGGYQIQNHNRLLYNYPGTIGVKDGYTVAARWTAIAAATRNGHSYLLTALRRGEGSWRPQAAMLDWAFAHGAQARPVGRLVSPEEVAATPAPSAVPAPAAQAAGARAGGTSAGATTDDRTRTVVGVVGVGAAVLAVVLLALSARSRRRQLASARAARAQRGRVRSRQ